MVVKQYKAALDKIVAGEYDEKFKEESEEELKRVFNRGFWENGYYMGKQLGEWSKSYGSQATTKKIQIGKVVNFFKKAMVAEIAVESGQIKIEDLIAFTGSTTGIVYSSLEKILDSSGNDVSSVEKGCNATVKLDEAVRRNDKVFLIIPRVDS